MEINKLLTYALESGASDLHLSSGSIPMVRITPGIFHHRQRAAGLLEVDRSTKRKWVFELQLSDQGGRIIATSTGDMGGGEGRVVEFDRESGDYRGYGTTERES